MITFEQFQASRTRCADLGERIADAHWDDEPVPATGNVYLACLYIADVLPHWPEAARNQGRWYLIIDRDEYITDDLALLERRLYDFALSEGYCDDDLILLAGHELGTYARNHCEAHGIRCDGDAFTAMFSEFDIGQPITADAADRIIEEGAFAYNLRDPE